MTWRSRGYGIIVVSTPIVRGRCGPLRAAFWPQGLHDNDLGRPAVTLADRTTRAQHLPVAAGATRPPAAGKWVAGLGHYQVPMRDV